MMLLWVGVLSGLTDAFQESMSVDRAFAPITAVVFGKWEPIGVFLGTLGFGATDALELRIQVLGLNTPYQFLVGLPYIVPLIVLILSVGKATWSAASDEVLKREAT